MKLLLDTHVFLWWYFGTQELGDEATKLIASSQHEVLVSAAVVWEIVIKRALGKLQFAGSVCEAITQEGFLPLPIETRHTEAVSDLAPHHQDPFDRLLLAQAKVEHLLLLTRDDKVLRYRDVPMQKI